MAQAPSVETKSFAVTYIRPIAAISPSHSGGPPFTATGPRIAPTSAIGIVRSQASMRGVIDT